MKTKDFKIEVDDIGHTENMSSMPSINVVASFLAKHVKVTNKSAYNLDDELNR